MSRGQKNLPSHQMKELHDAFNLFDRDQSGTISLSELKQILIALNFKPTDSLVHKVMKKMDTNGSGFVEFDEFVKVMSSIYQRKFTDEEMHRVFKCFDTDNSGYITLNELRGILSQLIPNIKEERVTDVLNKIDVDHDGQISYEEFVHMLEDL